MQIIKVYCAYFSPGSTTKKIVTGIARSFKDYPIEEINLTDYDVRQRNYSFKENELLIIGVPAYAGRVPAPVVEAVSRFHAEKTPVVLVASYGNRAVDDTLMELKNITTAQGFIPAAAATFIGQHTFLSECALGRPDEKDMAIVAEFGDKIRERLRTAVSYNLKELEVPGTNPYSKPPMGTFPFEVKTNEYCIYCMMCAHVCPVKAISDSNPYDIQHDKCLRCASCIRVCPAQAKSFTKEPFEALQAKLRACIEPRQEPWYTIG